MAGFLPPRVATADARRAPGSPGPFRGRPLPAAWLAALFLTAMAPGAAGPGAPAWAGGNPRLALPASGLGLPAQEPVYLAGLIGIGGAFSHANDQFGYGGQIIFRPAAAEPFLGALARARTGLVLQGDYQEMYHSYRIRSGDLILRRYLGRQAGGIDAGRPVAFVGLGLGVSEISYAAGDSTGTLTDWAPLVEAGAEWRPRGAPLLLGRAQYRHFDRAGHDYLGWTARLGVGFPLP